MEILKETEEVMSNMEVDMSNMEIQNLIEYFHNNCPDKIQNELKVNWAVNDILMKVIKEKENGRNH